MKLIFTMHCWFLCSHGVCTHMQGFKIAQDNQSLKILPLTSTIFNSCLFLRVVKNVLKTKAKFANIMQLPYQMGHKKWFSLQSHTLYHSLLILLLPQISFFFLFLHIYINDSFEESNFSVKWSILESTLNLHAKLTYLMWCVYVCGLTFSFLIC